MAHEILIVDDEADIRAQMSGILADEGYETREAANAAQALSAVNARLPGLVVLDIWLEGGATDGMGVLQVLRRQVPELPVVMISGHGSIETAVSAIRLGAYDFIEKPFKASRLLLVVQRAIEAARLSRENEELRLRAGQNDVLIGNSALMAAIRNAIARVAPTGSRVLITGPAGSGKEVAARMLHARSHRTAAPFIAVNCAIMAPERVEEELFGVEGAADGLGRRIGVFERAHGGTLFLDEVADMPLETQGKIVRALQDQTFTRLGSATTVSVDVRVIAATNRDLVAEMDAGRFRQDLFYRLNVVPIVMPALRAHREDIPSLAENFMARAATSSGLVPRRIGEDAMAALRAYDWPGNSRQLRNIIDWLLIMVPDNERREIGVDALPPEIATAAAPVLSMERGGELLGLPLRDAREMFERQYLEAQITRFGGSVSRTAHFIGMERSALHRKLKALGLVDGDRYRTESGETVERARA